MVTPGAKWLRLRMKFRHGLRVVYWCDFVRPRILKTKPFVSTDNKLCEIHALTCDGDWLNLVWMLKSFYYYSRRNYALCIHEDGSLSPSAKAALRAHFPRARLIERAAADSVMKDRLREYPLSMEFRNKNPLALKVFDFAEFLESPRMLLMDSDILFFSKPEDLLNRIEDEAYQKTSLNRDWAMGYTIEPDQIQNLVEFPIVNRINSGLGLLHKKALDFATYERFLAIPGVIGHHHRIEQTLIALACCRAGFEFLPEAYDVRIDSGNPVNPCKHYTGPIRHLMYREGIRHLVNRSFLRENTGEMRHSCPPLKAYANRDSST
jgi:hypothetical protein